MKQSFKVIPSSFQYVHWQFDTEYEWINNVGSIIDSAIQCTGYFNIHSDEKFRRSLSVPRDWAPTVRYALKSAVAKGLRDWTTMDHWSSVYFVTRCVLLFLFFLS